MLELNNAQISPSSRPITTGYPTAESRARDTTTRSPIQAFRIQTKPLNQCTKTILHSRDSASIFLMSIFSGQAEMPVHEFLEKC